VVDGRSGIHSGSEETIAHDFGAGRKNLLCIALTKSVALNLHIAKYGLEFHASRQRRTLRPGGGRVVTEKSVMKKLLLVALLTLVSLGAAGCQRPWFSRGAACNTCPTGIPECTPGTGMVGSGGYTDGVFPGPVQ